jgi:hypothetical protein
MLQARRASFLRDAMASLATRTASGMMRRNNSEMVCRFTLWLCLQAKLLCLCAQLTVIC